MNNYNAWTRKQFQELPLRKWDEDIGYFDTLIILPTRRKHDSGYRMMDFVANKGGVPFCRLSGCIDVIHIDGIGGYGDRIVGSGIPTLVKTKSWSIDCLMTSGLLNIFVHGHKLRCGVALSSFDIIAVKKEEAI